MYSFLIALLSPVIIYLIIGLISYIKDKETDFFSEESFENVGIITFALVVVTLLVTLFMPYDYHTEKITYNLESLEDGNSIEGQFFIGCGKINEELKYSFYYEDGGYYQLKQLDTYNTKIKYIKDKPKYIIYRKVLTDNLYNSFVTGPACDENKEHYVICVPKGTIKNNYYLDTK